MSVKPSELDNPERGMPITTRGTTKKDKEGETPTRLAALEQRIAAAKLDRALDRDKILKHDREPHCGDCFTRGWASAVAAIEGD